MSSIPARLSLFFYPIFFKRDGMSNTSAIHFYYHNQTPTEIECFFQQNSHPNQRVLVFIDHNKAMFSEATVPNTFNDEDVLQFIKVEQAKLFPVLNEHIYIDFYIKEMTERQENEKQIIIVACNASDFVEVNKITQLLHLDWTGLHIDLEEVKNLNLLPWRERIQREKHKKQRKNLSILTISLSFIMLIISLFFIKMAKTDRERENKITSKIINITPSIKNLEKINQDYQVLMQRWGLYAKNAKNQSKIAKTLIAIETQRPENLIVDNIKWRENILLMQGRARENGAIKKYLENLRKNNINGKLNLMSNLMDKTLPLQFEIEAVIKK